MTLELLKIIIETLIKALNDGILIQKQARLCDLAALDFIPTEILPHLKLHHQKAIAKQKFTFQQKLANFIDKQYIRDILKVIASNSFSSIEVLGKLALHRNFQIRLRVAMNSTTSIDILEKLIHDKELCVKNHAKYAVFQQTLRTKNNHSYSKLFSPYEVRIRKSDTDSLIFDKVNIAKDPNTSVDVLDLLATDDYK